MAKTLEEIIDSLFGDKETMTKAELTAAAGSCGMKLADLSDGDFVTKGKYDDHVAKMKKLQSDYDALKANPSESEQYKAIVKERDDWKAKYDESQTSITKAERREILSKMNVKPEFSSFLLSEIGAKVSDTVDFDTAAKKYLAENKQYTTTVEDTPAPSSGLRLGGSGAAVSGNLWDSLESAMRK